MYLSIVISLHLYKKKCITTFTNANSMFSTLEAKLYEALEGKHGISQTFNSRF